MDFLSQVLKLVTLKGAVFYNAEFTAPWSFRSPASRLIAPHLGPDSGHVIVYHLLLEGKAWVGLEAGQRVELNPGDIVIFPHGDSHLMGNGRPIQPVDNANHLLEIFSQGVEVVKSGGGGEVTRFICGYMTCQPQLSELVLAGLPPLLRVNIREDEAGAWLENSIQFSVRNVTSAGAGSEAVLAKLSEALFAETLRRYMANLPEGESGWMAGARDPEVGKALGLIHRYPARPWTIEDLAAEVGISRAVLAERFREYLQIPPIAYLTRWRLQLGSHLLTTTARGVAEIAAEVGYESEAAFNRAFKRYYNAPPARYRKDARVKAAAPNSVAAG